MSLQQPSEAPVTEQPRRPLSIVQFFLLLALIAEYYREQDFNSSQALSTLQAIQLRDLRPAADHYHEHDISVLRIGSLTITSVMPVRRLLPAGYVVNRPIFISRLAHVSATNPVADQVARVLEFSDSEETEISPQLSRS